MFEPVDDLSVVSTTSWTENFAGEDNVDPTNGNPGQPLDADDVDRVVDYDVPGSEGTETLIQSLNANWRLSDRFAIQSISTYQDTDYTRQEDFDNTSAPIAALDRIGSDEAISQELRLKYFGEKIEGSLGFYYFENEEGFTDSFVVPATIVNPALPASILVSRVSENTNETTNYAFFLDGRSTNRCQTSPRSSRP